MKCQLLRSYGPHSHHISRLIDRFIVRCLITYLGRSNCEDEPIFLLQGWPINTHMSSHTKTFILLHSPSVLIRLIRHASVIRDIYQTNQSKCG